MASARLASCRPLSQLRCAKGHAEHKRYLSSGIPIPKDHHHSCPSQSHTSTPQARQLRSIISLYHTAEHFAPLNDNERLIRFIDDSLLFKKGPTQYAAPNSPNPLFSTIKTLPFNQPILRPGENEQDLNPIMAAQRVRAGQARWRSLKDALCGSSASDIQDEPSRAAGMARFGSRFGALDLPGNSQTEIAGGKAGLEIVEENWEQIKQLEKAD